MLARRLESGKMKSIGPAARRGDEAARPEKRSTVRRHLEALPCFVKTTTIIRREP